MITTLITTLITVVADGGVSVAAATPEGAYIAILGQPGVTFGGVGIYCHAAR